MLPLWIAAAAGATALAVSSYRLGLLSGTGAIAASFVGAAIVGGGGVGWGAPLLLFFVSGSALSRLAPRNRFEAKGGRRDGLQVVANGGAAAVAALLFAATGEALWSVMALGSLAAAAADTWATEIGGTLRGRTISLLTLRHTEPGRSGGVSLGGTVGGVAGAAAIAAVGAGVGMVEWSLVPLVALAGTLGMLVDSAAGAALQYVGTCVVCGATVEEGTHCGARTERAQGVGWITNDVVNIFCTVIGGALACLLAYLQQ